MRRPLGLHNHSVSDLDPIALVEAAAACGYDQVTFFTNVPRVPHAGREDMFAFPAVTQKNKQEVLARLDAHGLRVIGAEFFLITPDADLASYVPGLAIGRELGARHAVTHMFETEPARAVDRLGSFCDLAAAEDLKVGIEFCAMTPGCKSIHQAAWFVDQVGRANLGFGICPMHLIRSGGTAEDIAALDARYFLFGQINDGHGTHASAAYFEEVHDRELPGDGDFPLHAILSALPAETPIEVKIPCDRRKAAGISGLEYAREAGVRSRALVDALVPRR